MGHPDIDNGTPFAFEVLFLLDEELQPVVVTLLKGTFAIESGACRVAEKQVPVSFGGECWGEDSATSSYKYEPEIAFFKPSTDVVLVGHAYAPRAGTTVVDVSLSVGPLRKVVRVFGDREWVHAGAGPMATSPLPFERMPLVFERAFGGWDRRSADPAHQAFESRNPVGVGFRRSFEAGVRLPNLEDPRSLIGSPSDRPPPACFGFVSPHWQPRAQLAGTYDAAWQTERAPRLPLDFDRRYLNAASPGLVAPSYLRGGERVVAEGLSAQRSLAFALPQVTSPTAVVARRNEADLTLPLNLDTIIVEPDEGRAQLMWRAYAPLRSGPHDVRAVAVSSI